MKEGDRSEQIKMKAIMNKKGRLLAVLASLASIGLDWSR